MTDSSRTESFTDFFETATGGLTPYAWQLQAAITGLPDVLAVPTGLGKTEVAVRTEVTRLRPRAHAPTDEARRRACENVVRLLPAQLRWITSTASEASAKARLRCEPLPLYQDTDTDKAGRDRVPRVRIPNPEWTRPDGPDNRVTA